jgi:hypothetical protein
MRFPAAVKYVAGVAFSYIELLDEPSYEFNLSGSPYTSINAAVDAYYYYGRPRREPGTAVSFSEGTQKLPPASLL